MLTLGIDIGSATSKVAVMRGGTVVLATALRRAGIGSDGPGAVLRDALRLAGCQMEDIAAVAATGYGRNMMEEADYRISELSCHGRGAHFLAPETRTLIDVGGQDAKVIRLDGRGRIMEFMMNDKCAAGTGRFLEVMAQVLGCGIQEFSGLAEGQEAAPISSTCAVFAETEVISRLAAGTPRGSIAAGINLSIAKRVGGLAMRMGVVPAVMMSGGVAQNASLVDMLGRELGADILVAKECQFCGALGAALLAWEKTRASGRKAP